MEKKDNKTTIGTVVLAIFIAFAVIMLIGMFSGSSTQPISETKPSETLTAKKTFWKETFIKGCDPAGNQTSGCLCIWNKMDARWTDEELASVFAEYAKTEKLPEAFTAFVSECVEV